MSDFDSTQLLDDWDDVLSRAGALTATLGGVTFSGVWAERSDMLADLDDQMRTEKGFTIFTTATQLATIPAARMTLVRSGVTYAVQNVRSDAETCGIEIDVRQLI